MCQSPPSSCIKFDDMSLYQPVHPRGKFKPAVHKTWIAARCPLFQAPLPVIVTSVFAVDVRKRPMLNPLRIPCHQGAKMHAAGLLIARTFWFLCATPTAG